MTLLIQIPTFLVKTAPLALMTESLAISAAPLTIGAGAFAAAIMGSAMVLQDFKLRKRADAALEDAEFEHPQLPEEEDQDLLVVDPPIAPAAVVMQNARQTFKRQILR